MTRAVTSQLCAPQYISLTALGLAEVAVWEKETPGSRQTSAADETSDWLLGADCGELL